MLIERQVKRNGGSLIIVIGHHESKNKNIEEGDSLVLEIKEVKKEKKKR